MNLSEFKANTIQQYHVLEFLRKHFASNTFIRIELIDRYTVKILDADGGTAYYKDTNEGVVKWQE